MTKPHVLVPFAPRGHNHDRCVRTALAVAQALCAEQGLRLTPIRRRVLELVWRRHQPVKAYETVSRDTRANPKKP